MSPKPQNPKFQTVNYRNLKSCRVSATYPLRSEVSIVISQSALRIRLYALVNSCRKIWGRSMSRMCVILTLHLVMNQRHATWSLQIKANQKMLAASGMCSSLLEKAIWAKWCPPPTKTSTSIMGSSNFKRKAPMLMIIRMGWRRRGPRKMLWRLKIALKT